MRAGNQDAGCCRAAAEDEGAAEDGGGDSITGPPHESALLLAAAAFSSAARFSLARAARPIPPAIARMPMSGRTGLPGRAATSLARFFWARVIGCLGVTAYVLGWPRGTLRAGRLPVVRILAGRCLVQGSC